MKILVTGSAGFIGFHVASALLKAGHTVAGLDNFSDYYTVQLKCDRHALLRQVPGKLLVIWDGAAIHRSQFVKAVLTASAGRLWLEKLPAYAPELNPVEYLWAHLKEHQIANLLGTHGWELSLHATAARRRRRRRPRMIRACWRQAELCL